ncbi:NeuD/PglB/VioB family sugar acetyltransferase [Candidatus Omnitrophota bacterium]
MRQDKVHEINVPRINASDDSVILTHWYIEEGQNVLSGDPIASIETSKASFDVESSKAGYVYRIKNLGEAVAVGDAIAIVVSSLDFPVKEYRERKEKSGKKKEVVQEENKTAATRFSKAAESLIDTNSINRSVFSHLELVGKKDVLDYIDRKRTVKNNPIKDKSISKKILILGGGGHAKKCIEILRSNDNFEIAGIIDKDLEIGYKVLGIPVVGRDSDLSKFYSKGILMAVLGIGAVINHVVRTNFFKLLKDIGFHLPNIIHPSAVVESTVGLGEGNQVMANATIESSVKIADNCIIDCGSIICHDCEFEDNVHVAPGAILAGSICVGRDTLIGMGVTVYMNLKIGSRVVIYNGSNIMRNIKDEEIISGDNHNDLDLSKKGGLGV